MKKFIVPIDFTGESIKALKVAIIYANKFHSDLQMVFVQEIKSRKSRLKFEKEYEMAIEGFEEILNKYKKKLHKNCDFSYIIKKGDVCEQIKNQAEAFDYSMIICSTNGESGLSNLIIGNNTYRIIQNTSRPVISVASEKIIGEVKKIVLPIDHTKETREKVPMVVKVAKKFNSEVHIVKVTSTKDKAIHRKLNLYETQVKNILDNKEIKYNSSLLIGKNITDLTVDYAKSVSADLIAIMTEQSVSFSNLVLGSYANQMLNNSPIPVLSITPREIYLTTRI